MFSLVIPTRNERGSIEHCIKLAAAALNGINYEIIVSDDNSPDGTWKAVAALNHPRVKVFRRTANHGLSAAVLDAFKIARGSRLGVMDGDLQHDPRILPRLLEALDCADLAVGSRNVAGGCFGEIPWHRLALSKSTALFTRWYLRLPLRDPLSGYFVLRRELYESVRDEAQGEGFKILLELYCAAHRIEHVEIPFSFAQRYSGVSKLNAAVARQFLSQLRRLRMRRREILRLQAFEETYVDSSLRTTQPLSRVLNA